MRRLLVAAVVVLTAVGCAGKRSSLLLERHAMGPLSESAKVAQRMSWMLEPVSGTQQQGDVDVTVTFASHAFLQKFFSDRDVFKNFAGKNPYFPENIVFYVKIANRGKKVVAINPAEFALVDDRGNQFNVLNVDYVTALEEARKPVATMTRGVIEDARPGYFGLSLPIGKIISTRPQGRFALIKQSSLQAGRMYPGVVHDGLVAFWTPAVDATTLRFTVADVRTNFLANGEAQTVFEFPFEFHVVKSQ